MPAYRKHPARASQQRNARSDEQPARTRYRRGARSAPSRGEKLDVVSPKTSPTQSNGHLVTRKATRSSSNISSFSNLDVVAPEPEVFAEFDAPILIIHGLSSKFLEDLIEKEKRTQRKERMWTGHFTHSDLENETSSDESDVPTPPLRGAFRGGRGRGSRGGRGRGRGRGRGGRGRGSSSTTRDMSPFRARKTRNAAPMQPLTEEDEADSTNQESAIEDAKDSQPDAAEDAAMTDTSEDEEDDEANKVAEKMEDAYGRSTTPPGSLPPEPGLNLREEVAKALLPVPRVTLLSESTSRIPKESDSTVAPTPTQVPTPKLLDPEDDVLSDSDLPGPWIQDYIRPKEIDCEDRADYLLKTRYNPLTDVQDIIAALTKYPASQRSTETLYLLAANTQEILKAWQDEYLILDAKTAPHAHPPKKPANGGRIPVDPLVFEDMKESDLYGYVYDQKKLPGAQDPFAQRIGAEKSGGRELRQRRVRDMLDSAAPSEDEEEDENDGRGVGKRQRRATRRFDSGDQTTGTTTPRKSGWGGARKKGVSKYAQPTSETPEPEARAAKRQKLGGNSLLHQRIQRMREESAVTSSGDEGSSANSQDVSDAQYNDFRKRGRPAGSKNSGRRSDYGIKKGPRKKGNEVAVAGASEQAPSVPPQVLQSLSEGQNQFSVDPRPPTPQQMVPGYAGTPPIMPPQPVATVFQATPQPPTMPESGVNAAPIQTSAPETYMNTTPLSQYSHPYADESATTPGSGSRRKPRVKSEKRSQSMTIWWAERKARQRELEGKTVGDKPAANGKVEESIPSSRKGSRASSIARTEPPPPPPSEPVIEPQSQVPPQPLPPPPVVYPYSYAQIISGPSPVYAYSPTAPPPPPPPPPHQMYIQHSPLTALPSGPSQGLPSLQMGPRSSMPPLAPAPMPPQPKSYPSPYGPRMAPRPKSSGPPPLAPAPAHVSPYPPPSGPGPTMQREITEMSFKVLVPGPPPGTEADMR